MKTPPDPIVEEVHQARAAIAARFHDDLHAICEDARQRQAAASRNPVSLPARPAEPTPPVTKQVG